MRRGEVIENVSRPGSSVWFEIAYSGIRHGARLSYIYGGHDRVIITDGEVYFWKFREDRYRSFARATAPARRIVRDTIRRWIADERLPYNYTEYPQIVDPKRPWNRWRVNINKKTLDKFETPKSP